MEFLSASDARESNRIDGYINRLPTRGARAQKRKEEDGNVYCLQIVLLVESMRAHIHPKPLKMKSRSFIDHIFLMGCSRMQQGTHWNIHEIRINFMLWESRPKSASLKIRTNAIKTGWRNPMTSNEE